jgi:GntR family transcriptional regulator, transcriptional repressor for pyruvate dehydrogenase complex
MVGVFTVAGSHRLSYNCNSPMMMHRPAKIKRVYTRMASRSTPHHAVGSAAIATPNTVLNTPPHRSRNLATALVEAIGDRIRDGRLAVGDKLPTEAEIMGAFGVSRTVVREALSKLQAGSQVRTRHGIGTFVLGKGEATPFSITPDQLATLQDVIAMLELRTGVETETAALAAQRRSPQNMHVMRQALDEFAATVEAGREAVSADVRFHLEIARATNNKHFAEVIAAMGVGMIPRARLDTAQAPAVMSAERRDFLRRVNAEHESIYNAIVAQDSEAARAAMRTHLVNSRERRRREQGPSARSASPVSARSASPAPALKSRDAKEHKASKVHARGRSARSLA